MKEGRRTLHYNPYNLVDLGKEPNLGLPMIYANAFEHDLEKESEIFEEKSYDCVVIKFFKNLIIQKEI